MQSDNQLLSAAGRLSVVVPCYNEAPTLKLVIDRVLDSPFTGEVIIVDDGSTDDTLKIAMSIGDDRVRVFMQPHNMGKGAALRRGFREATLDYVVVQDADLEYDPAEFGRLLGPLVRGDADVVYGSRFAGGDAHSVLYFWHSVGNKLLTTFSNALTNLNLTDMETCYKAFRRDVIQSITIEEDRFGFEPEITAKIASRGFRVYEVGISYQGRTYAEGKKIGWRDGARALYCMFHYSRLWPKRDIKRYGVASTDSQLALAENLSDLDSAAENYSRWIASLQAPYVGDDVLEIGAGHGTMTKLLADKARHVVACDVSPVAVRTLRDRFDSRSDIEIFEGGVEGVGTGEFDTAVLTNVLEHIEDDVKFLVDVRSRLRAGGHVTVFAPAFESLYSDFDREIGHFRRYRQSTLATSLSDAGFEVVTAHYVNMPGALAWWFVARQLGRRPTTKGLATAYDKLVVPVTSRIERRRRPPFGQSVFAVGRKSSAAALGRQPAGQ